MTNAKDNFGIFCKSTKAFSISDFQIVDKMLTHWQCTFIKIPCFLSEPVNVGTGLVVQMCSQHGPGFSYYWLLSGPIHLGLLVG